MRNIVSLILLVFFLFSCGNGEPISGFTQHVYKNHTDHFIKTCGYSGGVVTDSFSIEANKEYLEEIPPRKGENNGPYNNPLYEFKDSVLIYFNDTLLIHYDIGRLDGNPMRIENFELVEGETEPYIYLFEFTNEDYERALERGRIVK